eukprot:Skav221092  [mRNA]  locus=scaffold1024:228820:239201:+ [translate_table: standard]
MPLMRWVPPSPPVRRILAVHDRGVFGSRSISVSPFAGAMRSPHPVALPPLGPQVSPSQGQAELGAPIDTTLPMVISSWIYSWCFTMVCSIKCWGAQTAETEPATLTGHEPQPRTILLHNVTPRLGTLHDEAVSRGVCNGTAGAIFLQQHHRAHRSDAVLRVASECSSSTDDCRETGLPHQELAPVTGWSLPRYWASCRQSCEPGESNPNDDPDTWLMWSLEAQGDAELAECEPAWQGKARLFEFLAALTDQPVPNSQARAVHSSGGAGGGVVSGSQGRLGSTAGAPWGRATRYGLLLTGTLLAASPNDPDRQKLMDHTYESWRRARRRRRRPGGDAPGRAVAGADAQHRSASLARGGVTSGTSSSQRK